MLELTPRYGFLFLCHVRTEHLFLWPSSQVLEFLSPKCYVLTGVFLSAGAICISSITGIQRSEYRGLCGRPTYSSIYRTDTILSAGVPEDLCGETNWIVVGKHASPAHSA